MRTSLIKPILVCVFLAMLCVSIASAGSDDPAGFEGRWHGFVQMDDGDRIETVLVANESGDDWVIRITQLGEKRHHQPILDAAVDGERITLNPIIDDVIQIWRGELDVEERDFSGTVLINGRKSGRFRLQRSFPARGVSGSRVLSGSVILPGRDFEHVRLHLLKDADGWRADVDLPDRGISGYPAKVMASESGLSLGIPSESEVQLQLISAGPLVGADASDQVMAAWTEEGTTVPVLFRWQPGNKSVGVLRPQMPVPPFSYSQTQLVIEHPIGHKLGATLVRPDSDRAVPAVVLISSGLGIDRDDLSDGHRYQAVWADALARRGIASLRFDDRGVGESGMSAGSRPGGLGIKDKVMDVRYLLEWLGEQEGVDPSQRGLVGWDQGGIAAMMVASGMPRDVAYVVLLATPGLPERDMAKHRMRQMLEGLPFDSDRIQELAKRHGILIDVASDSEASDAEIREVIGRYLTARSMLATGQAAQISDNEIESAFMSFGSTPYRTLLRLDPRMILPRLRCPVLAVTGSFDLVTPPAVSLPNIEWAVQRTGGEATLIELSGLNHRLQPSDAENTRSSERIRATVDPSALIAVADWIFEIVGPAVKAKTEVLP
ncbi:MAG: hypothetical protein CMJ40_07680 [Phycisphaerae bacterium]|nr:hypothetical protein [Phycisphaerae bacterium]|tara:strand:- start:523 stop:2337 length:1815 start_codon:yes stop_codon:yes gene_type:complete